MLLPDDGAVSPPAMSALTNAGDRPLMAIAFSGGLDSTVLLDLMCRLWPPDRLLALHVHHHLQPAADAWPAHCRTFATARGVRCRVLHAESQPAPGESIEQWARNERYRLLAAEARMQGAAALLTAHHADDQAETLLLRMSRGAGPRGLAGILPVRHVLGLPVLRPLLDVRRAELTGYARREGLHWIEDPSNEDPRFARNRLRQQVLPDAEVMRLVAEAERARVAWERIERVAAADVEAAMVAGAPGRGDPPVRRVAGVPEADRAMADAPGPNGSLGPLDRGILRSLPRERAVWALREWVCRFGVPPPSRAQTDQLMHQLIDGSASDAEVIVRDVALLRHRDRLFGIRGASAARLRRAAAAALEPVVLRDLTTATGYGQEPSVMELPAGLGRLYLRCDRPDALSGLRVTDGGQGGRRLRPGAGRPSRTLKNLYQEAGVPGWLRPLYPVVLAQDEVVFSAALGHGVPSGAGWPSERDESHTGGSPIVGWEPPGDDDLSAVLRRHMTVIAAPPAGVRG